MHTEHREGLSGLRRRGPRTAHHRQKCSLLYIVCVFVLLSVLQSPMSVSGIRLPWHRSSATPPVVRWALPSRPSPETASVSRRGKARQGVRPLAAAVPPKTSLSSSGDGECGVCVGSQAVVEGMRGAAAGLGMGVQRFCEVLLSKKEDLIAGAVARGVMVFCLYPIDTVKTRIQMFGAKAGLKGLSLPGLYAGVGSSLLGQMPYGMLVYGIYEVCKELVPPSVPWLSQDGVNVLSAVVGDVSGSVWLCPSEVIKQQMQSASDGNRVGMGQAVKACWQGNGLKGFYQGYSGQLMRDIPFRALQMPMYEKAVEALDSEHLGWLERVCGKEWEAWKSGIAGVLSGSVAAALTTPLDVVKTRLMVATHYKGTLHCMLSIAKAEGVQGLFSGVVPRVAYIGPSTALFFVVYGAVKEYLASQGVGPCPYVAEEDRQHLARLRGGTTTHVTLTLDTPTHTKDTKQKQQLKLKTTLPLQKLDKKTKTKTSR